jgi:hypothetical protein
MDYYHAIARTGELIDAAGVAVIVVGMLISAGAAVVGLGHHETGTYRRFRHQLGRTILLDLELPVADDGWTPKTRSPDETGPTHPGHVF